MDKPIQIKHRKWFIITVAVVELIILIIYGFTSNIYMNDSKLQSISSQYPLYPSFV
jgi:uncharacterized membrane protein